MNQNLEKIIKNGNFDVDIDLIDKKNTDRRKPNDKDYRKIFTKI